MTNEEAKRRLEVWLKCMDCPEDKQCYDSHLHSTCEYTDYCDETPVSEAVKVAIKALEQQPCDDAISRKDVEECKELMTDINGDTVYVVRMSDIRQLPSVTQKLIECDDAISRQAVLDGLASIAKAKAKSDAQKALMGRVMFFTEQLPSVTPQQKYGKWIAQQEANGDDYFKAYDISGVMTYAAKYKCDKCGFIQICIEDHGQYNYCPHCGCRMVEPQESEVRDDT